MFLLLCWSLYFYVQGQYHAKGAALIHLHDLSRGRGERGAALLLLHFARQPYESIVFVFAAARSPSGRFSGAGYVPTFLFKISNFAF